MMIKQKEALEKGCCIDRGQTCIGDRCMGWTYLENETADPKERLGTCGRTAVPPHISASMLAGVLRKVFGVGTVLENLMGGQEGGNA